MVGESCSDIFVLDMITKSCRSMVCFTGTMLSAIRTFRVETLLYKCLSLSWDLIESSTEKKILQQIMLVKICDFEAMFSSFEI